MDRNARNAMIVEHLPLVGYIVSDVRARATHLDRDDLAAVGSLALVAAAEAFDPGLGVPFGAYARTRITGALADDMRSADWASRGTRKRIRETLATQEALSARLGRSVGVQEIADAMGVDRQTAADAMSDAGRTVGTLDETVHDVIASDQPLPGEDLLEAEKRRYLRAAVAALPDRMRFVVENVYFGDRSVTEVPPSSGSRTPRCRSSGPRRCGCCATDSPSTTATGPRSSRCPAPPPHGAARTWRGSPRTPPPGSPGPCRTRRRRRPWRPADLRRGDFLADT